MPSLYRAACEGPALPTGPKLLLVFRDVSWLFLAFHGCVAKKKWAQSQLHGCDGSNAASPILGHPKNIKLGITRSVDKAFHANYSRQLELAVSLTDKPAYFLPFAAEVSFTISHLPFTFCHSRVLVTVSLKAADR